MTTQTIHPARHVPTRSLALAMAGAALAVAAGAGIVAITTEDVVAPTTGVEQGTGDYYDGTNREVRDLMHRR